MEDYKYSQSLRIAIISTVVGAIVGGVIGVFGSLSSQIVATSTEYMINNSVNVEKAYFQVSNTCEILLNEDFNDKKIPIKKLMLGESDWGIVFLEMHDENLKALYNRLLDLDELREKIISATDKSIREELISAYWSEFNELRSDNSLYELQRQLDGMREKFDSLKDTKKYKLMEKKYEFLNKSF